MEKHIGTRGMIGMPAILVILGIILVGGIGYSVMKDPMGDGMEKKDVMADEKMMMEKKDAMMEKPADSMKKDETMMEKPIDGAMMKKEDSAMMEKPMDGAMYKGTVLAGKSSLLLDYNKADYDVAVKSGKLVTLFFYATWCPLCKAEFPKMIEAFNGYTGSDVVGFRVNYKDGDTDADEKALAAQFGVAYQHTKVFVKGGTQVLKAPDTWDTARYLSEIGKHI